MIVSVRAAELYFPNMKIKILPFPIADKKIVGDKDEVFGFLPSSDQSFRSPSKAFRDIGNITPKGKGNTPM